MFTSKNNHKFANRISSQIVSVLNWKKFWKTHGNHYVVPLIISNILVLCKTCCWYFLQLYGNPKFSEQYQIIFLLARSQNNLGSHFSYNKFNDINKFRCWMVIPVVENSGMGCKIRNTFVWFRREKFLYFFNRCSQTNKIFVYCDRFNFVKKKYLLC